MKMKTNSNHDNFTHDATCYSFVCAILCTVFVTVRRMICTIALTAKKKTYSITMFFCGFLFNFNFKILFILEIFTQAFKRISLEKGSTHNFCNQFNTVKREKKMCKFEIVTVSECFYEREKNAHTHKECSIFHSHSRRHCCGFSDEMMYFTWFYHRLNQINQI